jgi:hypothetical protein
MCNGTANFGPRVRPKAGRAELYAIVGVTDFDTNGIPTFDATLVPTIVHEFAHSFINPFVERHRQQFASAGERLFPHVAGLMEAQAYGNWESVLYESLVRGVVIRYLRANGNQQGASRQLAEEFGLGFVWIQDLDRLLQQYNPSPAARGCSTRPSRRRRRAPAPQYTHGRCRVDSEPR